MYFRKLVIQMVTLSNHEGVASVWQRARGGLTNLIGMLGSRDSYMLGPEMGMLGHRQIKSPFK